MSSLVENLHTLTRRAPNSYCTKETCPVSHSTYGYAPSLPGNAFFLAVFFLFCIIHAVQGWRYRTWYYSGAMFVGALCEGIGEIGRLMLHFDPFNDPGFKLQVVLLTFAPAFFAAAIYLMLKHLVITFNASLSRLPPAWYTYIFITCDVLAIALQGAGGGVSAGSQTDAQLRVGDNIMISGLVLQVFTLLVFGGLAGEYFWRVRRSREAMNPATEGLRRSGRFRLFLGALVVAYVAILVRCIYRVVELAPGWHNPIMALEWLFLVFDSTMCTIAIVVLSVFHPGRCFPYRNIEGDKQISRESKMEAASSEEGVQSSGT